MVSLCRCLCIMQSHPPVQHGYAANVVFLISRTKIALRNSAVIETSNYFASLSDSDSDIGSQLATSPPTHHQKNSCRSTKLSPLLSFHQSHFSQSVPSQCLAQAMAMPLAAVRSWVEQTMFIMGQTSRCSAELYRALAWTVTLNSLGEITEFQEIVTRKKSRPHRGMWH